MTGVHQPPDVFPDRDVEMVDIPPEQKHLLCGATMSWTNDEGPFTPTLSASDIHHMYSDVSDDEIGIFLSPDISNIETSDASAAGDRASYAQIVRRDPLLEVGSSGSRNTNRPGPPRGPSSASDYGSKPRKIQSSGWSPKNSFNTSALGSHKSNSNGDLCIVCHKSPRYSKAGRSYSTCGLKCASRLREKGKAMCQVCDDRPVAVRSNGEVLQTCGYTCSRKLKSQSGTQVVKGKCKTCLVCWREDCLKLSHTRQFCSEECARAPVLQAPTLIEVPRGHSHFYDRAEARKVSGQFEAEWDSNTQDRPTISRIYCIVPPAPVTDRWIEFKGRMERQQRGRGVTKTNLWIGATRRCDIGDSDIQRCEDPMCMLCNVLVNGVVPQQPLGVHAFRNPNRADGIFAGKSTNPNQSRAMFLVDVISNKEAEMSIEQFTSPPPTGSHGHNFVRIVKYSRLGFSQDTGELCLYLPQSVLPRYIVIYSQTV